MDEQARNEVLTVYTAYLAAFRANDIAALDQLIQYPLAYIGESEATLVDTYPFNPAALKATKQWHDTIDFSYEVVFASAVKAHLILRRATRIRADGSPIETISAFYALSRSSAGWKFIAMSDITVSV